MKKIVKLTDGLPITSTQAVFDEEGNRLDNRLNNHEKSIMKHEKSLINIQDKIAHMGDGVIPITYEKLKGLRDNGKLSAGSWYRMTDYECTTTQKNTRSAGHTFDLLIFAIDEKTLSEECKACVNKEHKKMWFYDGDHCVSTGEKYMVTDANGVTKEATFFRCYEYDKIAGFFIAGGIKEWDSRTAQILWFNEDEGGIIDKKNKTSKTIESSWDTDWNLLTSSFGYFSNSHLEAWRVWYCIDNDEHRFAWADAMGKGVIYRMIDEWNNDCPYDFKNIQFIRPVNSNGGYDLNGIDTWVYTFSAYDMGNGVWMDACKSLGKGADDGCCACYSNVIKPYCFKYEGAESLRYRLNDIVFLNMFDDESDIYYECYSNTFGNNCYSNTFGDGCYSNTFGNNCCDNTFGDGCYSNTFGNNCNYNTFRDNCRYNTFEDYCHDNTFEDYCHDNTFGDNCYSNTFGDNCNSNTFGDSCYYNTFGILSTQKSYMQYVTIESGVSYTYINCADTTSSSKYGQNIHVNSGVKGVDASNRKTIEIATAGNEFLTTFGSVNDVKVNV